MKKFGKWQEKLDILCCNDVALFLCLPAGSYRSQPAGNERKGKWKPD